MSTPVNSRLTGVDGCGQLFANVGVDGGGENINERGDDRVDVTFVCGDGGGDSGCSGVIGRK